ncbi:MAG: DNA translocase FtsK 4TM domain-containing protein [Rhodobacteraceae bacterium]|nr:DNA translocase FtsK 4TM domain-containing protein [Paracoccaceae bacterium]MCY4196264.1 DNA translocase FtsK 4TM domain-containing protein [Paracoccaceae bacterium]
MTYQQLGQGESLIDESMSLALKRRARELVGLFMLGAGAFAAIAVGTYSAEDSGLLISSGAQTQNLTGATGAEVVSVFMATIGLATWCFPFFFCLWGLRYLSHFGQARFTMRIMFLPVFVIITSVVAAGLPYPEGWVHGFGAGGMLGDAIFGALTYSWPAGFVGSSQAVTSLAMAALILCALIAHGATLRGTLAILLFTASSTGTVIRFVCHSLSRTRPEYTPAEIESGKGLFNLFRRHRVRDEPTIEETWDTDNDECDSRAHHHGSDHPEVSRTPPKLMQILSAALRWRPSFRFPEIHNEMPVRRAVEPTLTLGTDQLEFGSGLAETREEAEIEEQLTVVELPKSQTRKRTRSRAALREDQPPLIGDDEITVHKIPPLSLLQESTEPAHPALSTQALMENARMLESVLKDYGVHGTIKNVRLGPVVTLYELTPEAGLKASRVIGLADDIARNMTAFSARISTVPGRNIIGIELPNATRETVYLRELLADKEFGDSRMELAIALGKDIGGEPQIVDLVQMPHLLIAGTTGSGKSVAINTMILSLLYRLPPEDCRMIMIDPKMLELSVYDGIPHLLVPVVTDPKKAVVALKWVVAEMEERYRLMSTVSVRKLTSYNERMREALRQGKKITRRFPNGFDENGDQIFCEEEREPETLPYIVVVVDEMADLMMVAGKEIEACIQRLAQMARASGIHLVMATQRPSVDVITGTVKANFPTRVSFQVTSKIDSRTILGEQGAEQLLGRGDMLYMSGGSQIGRVHGPFVTDEEVEQVVSFLKQQGEPDYLAEVLDGSENDAVDTVLGLAGDSQDADSEYSRAVQIVQRDRKCSTSYIQRKLEIGYNKAARIVERMEDEGLISAANHVGKREILIPE